MLDAQILTKLTTRGCRTIGTTDDKTFTGSLTYRAARNAAEIWVTSRSTTTSSPFRALELIEHREKVGAHLLPGAAACTRRRTDRIQAPERTPCDRHPYEQPCLCSAPAGDGGMMNVAGGRRTRRQLRRR
jgi:hypothetical protein